MVHTNYEAANSCSNITASNPRSTRTGTRFQSDAVNSLKMRLLACKLSVIRSEQEAFQRTQPLLSYSTRIPNANTFGNGADFVVYDRLSTQLQL